MLLRRLFIGLLLLTVFAAVGLILYDVVEEGAVVPAAPMPTSTPFVAPTARPIFIPPTAEPTPSPSTYILQPGQTLADVAVLYDLTAEQLAEYNELSDPNEALSAGTELAIPPSSSP